jgi:hypothetical protein
MLGAVMQSNGVNVTGLNIVYGAVHVVNSQQHAVLNEIDAISNLALSLDAAATAESNLV